MRIGDAILLRLSRAPSTADYANEDVDPRDPLSLVRDKLEGFEAAIAGGRVVDFGCGRGRQSAALIDAGAAEVLGIDQNGDLLDDARQHAAAHGVDDRVEFVLAPDEGHRGGYDVVLSQNAMEHFADPSAVLAQMKELLRPGGRIYLTFGPPWYAPYGGHMHFFTRVPWVTLLFSERTVLRVRSHFRDDVLSSYEEAGLNRMSIRDFERRVADSGMRMCSRRYECVKGQSWLARLPVLRELFINHVSCVLEVPGASVAASDR